MIRFVLLSFSLLLSLLPYQMAAAATHASPCSRPTSKKAACFAKLLSFNPTAAPSGYSPSQLRSAYGAVGSGAARIAIVDAYGDASIKSDLDVYSRTFGLPVMPMCGSAGQTGCFEKTDQAGGQHFPRTNAGWSMETALDVEAAHGICPGCRIELVQASSASLPNLLAAVDQAVRSGAQIVSMSWGGSESSSELAADAHFQAPGVTFVASSGDSGYGTSWPAASSRVLAVGGTHLTLTSTGHRSSETAWSGAGSGCSKYEAKPGWQHDPSCGRRTIADVSAVADPATGAAIYSRGGWYSVGGTSLAAPVVASLAALAGPVSPATLMNRLYGSLGTGRLYDPASGANGSCATYLCRSLPGYDGPTGVGAPLGLGAL